MSTNTPEIMIPTLLGNVPLPGLSEEERKEALRLLLSGQKIFTDKEVGLILVFFNYYLMKQTHLFNGLAATVKEIDERTLGLKRWGL